jgi:hypothetical protein
MLLKAEDQGKFRARIVKDDSKVWASYSIEGRVNDAPMTQSDKQLFASELEARSWLTGEAEKRGFTDVEPAIENARA